MPNTTRMTPERRAEILALLDRRQYSMGLATRAGIEELLAELDAVTRERDEARKRVEYLEPFLRDAAHAAACRGES